jgi:phosphoglycolate phosphatase
MVSRRRVHVLVDLDGTISDSSIGIGRSLQHAFAACGYPPPTDAEVRTVIGPPFEHGLPRLGIEAGHLESVIEAYRERYEDVGLYENAIYPGVREMLDSLVDDGHVVALATAKPQHTAIRIVEYFGLTSHFTLQAGATVAVGSARRTKADVIRYALDELQAASTTPVVMVGDRDHDVEGAHANGIGCIGVSWGFGSHEELLGAGAIAVVDHPSEVVATVSSIYGTSRP